MTETELQDALKALLEEVSFMDADDFDQYGLPDELAGLASVRSFEEDGVLTGNAGLVITTADDRQFQLTIVQSR